ncbi:hypothetical protein [Pelagicoccus sp. SDUM812002]|uniref:hypothetical protein n=1 Tax=Pelagicoccus sp. SDUM812002 TaxID=3041266 RepID=UPI00280FD035|nr:hypothetical protein [Pelagicoccus sp. SDUM812002]MDQ8188603.1 hypothetical protein [Pelagicoccus sp. SDUM812002]
MNKTLPKPVSLLILIGLTITCFVGAFDQFRTIQFRKTELEIDPKITDFILGSFYLLLGGFILFVLAYVFKLRKEEKIDPLPKIKR